METVTELTSNSIKSILVEIFETDKIMKLQLLTKLAVNTLYSFEVEGKRYVMKILTRPVTVENEFYRLEKEAELMRQFSVVKKATGIPIKERSMVPVPEIFHIESDTNKLGCKFIIMSKVQGENLENIWIDLDSTKKEIFIEEFSKIVKNIHAVKFDMFGEIEEYRCPRRFYTYASFLKANLRRTTRLLGTRTIIPTNLIMKAQKFVEDNLDRVSYSSKPSLIHADLNPSNVVIKDKKSMKISAILDFEWSYAGDTLLELFDIQEMWLLDEQLEQIFFDNYGIEIPNKNDVRKRIYKIMAYLNTITYGWVYFHPTEENIERVIKCLKMNLGEE